MKSVFVSIFLLFFGMSLAAPVSSTLRAARSVDGNTTTWFNKYHSYQSHVDYLHRLAAKHPSMAAVFSAGKSFEQRDIWGIHLFGKSGPGIAPAVVFLGTIHAREWITTMATEYVAHSLLNQYGADAKVKSVLDSFDFYIFPVVNPDGFVYTQTNHRMWRKNRQVQKGSPCVGRDLNRNWDVHWDQKGGASSSPCHGTYRGSKPLDAPETRALASELQAIKERQGLRLFIDWHAFSQLVMYPYGYSCNKKLPAFSATTWLAGELAGAMKKVHGVEYQTGTACELLYPTSGDSADWAFEKLRAEHAYTVELRPGKRGKGGFKLPEREILPTVEEVWGGVSHVLQFIQY